MKAGKTATRRIACNEVMTPEGQRLIQYVLEISDGIVLKHYPLLNEMPFTEWFQGQIVLRDDEQGNIVAYYRGKPIT
jgi:hypothetical protein